MVIIIYRIALALFALAFAVGLVLYLRRRYVYGSARQQFGKDVALTAAKVPETTEAVRAAEAREDVE